MEFDAEELMILSSILKKVVGRIKEPVKTKVNKLINRFESELSFLEKVAGSLESLDDDGI